MILAAALALAITMNMTPVGIEWRVHQRPDGSVIRYAVAMPRGFDATRSYPVLIAFPPGDQRHAMVGHGLDRYWAKEAERRGWIVVSPAAPERTLFFAGGEWAVPELLDRLAHDFHVERDLFHLAGVSNGGKAAFRVAGLWPHRFASLTVLPGYPPEDVDVERLGRLVDTPTVMFVGGDDEEWVQKMHETHEQLKSLGSRRLELIVLEGEGHTPESLDGGSVVFDHLDAFRAEADALDLGRTEAAAMLDDFHRAAANADGYRYFSHFAPDAVFLGTDAAERWTVDDLRAYAEPRFIEGQGWTYEPFERDVRIAVDGKVIWFDERLRHAKYGEVRGSGVLVRITDTWKIAQYNLSIPVPNALADDLVQRIRDLKR